MLQGQEAHCNGRWLQPLWRLSKSYLGEQCWDGFSGIIHDCLMNCCHCRTSSKHWPHRACIWHPGKSNKTCHISAAVFTSRNDGYIRIKKLVKEELKGYLKENLIAGSTVQTVCWRARASVHHPPNQLRKRKQKSASLNSKATEGYWKHTGILQKAHIRKTERVINWQTKR